MTRGERIAVGTYALIGIGVVIYFAIMAGGCEPPPKQQKAWIKRPSPTPAPVTSVTRGHAHKQVVTSAPQKVRIDQRSLWKQAIVNKGSVIRIDKQIQSFQRNQVRYEKIGNGRAPWFIIACLHYRESDNDFHTMAHDGEPLTHRTRDEPRNRLPHPDPPYTFEQSAEDAYFVCDKLQNTDWSDVQSALDRTEAFNGFGYRSRGLNSPYNYSGTNLYERGKFVGDHRFDPTAMDKQLGVVAILKRMEDRGMKVF